MNQKYDLPSQIIIKPEMKARKQINMIGSNIKRLAEPIQPITVNLATTYLSQNIAT